MKKTIFEEMGGTYIRHGDYLIPALTLPKDVGRILRTFKIKKNVEVGNRQWQRQFLRKWAANTKGKAII